MKRLLAVIPARGGSKGLPGKNIRSFAGLPLIVHSVLFARMCPEITRCVVSTDSQEIVETALRYGADIPFVRPADLARDDTPIWPVLRHALSEVEREEGRRSYDALLLLDPTSPAREPSDISGAWKKLKARRRADGIIGVNQPSFNPVWHCVMEEDGWMRDLIKEGSHYDRRQEAPPVFRINGSLYIWRASFVRAREGSWRRDGRHLIYEIPEFRSMSIDTEFEFRSAELLVKSGLIWFSWLSETVVNGCQA